MLKFLCLLPWAGSAVLARRLPLDEYLGDDYVIVDGWILKKSDLSDIEK
jgi:hypothetical protein